MKLTRVKIGKIVVGVLTIFAVLFMLYLELLRGMDESHLEFFCSTPYPAAIRGQVIRWQDLSPVPNAQITMSTTGPCDYYSTFSDVQVTADDKGKFDLPSAYIYVSQTVEITITSQGCQTYRGRTSFDSMLLKSDPTIIRISCYLPTTPDVSALIPADSVATQ